MSHRSASTYRLCLHGTAALSALACAPVLAQTVTLPQSDTTNYAGSAFSISNIASSTTTRYAAIRGNETGGLGTGVLGTSAGTGGAGLYGQSAGADSFGLVGANAGTGFGGFFNLTGKATTTGSAALKALNAGGSTTLAGNYGQAGNFQITNPNNTDTVVYAKNAGPGVTIFAQNDQLSDVIVGQLGSAGSPYDGVTAAVTGTDSLAAALGFSVAAVAGTSNANVGIKGASGSGVGVFGFLYQGIDNSLDVNYPGAAVMAFDQSSAGSYTYGLWANSPNNVAVYGSSGHNVAAQFQYGSAGLGQCYFAGGPGWSCSSDRDIKEAFVPVDGTTLLDELAGLPVFEYAMKGSTDKARYLGPTAQDFRAAFHLGADEKTINTANAQGVAVAAAKALYVRLKADEATLAAQNEKIASLEAQLAAARTAMAGIGAMKASLEQLQATVGRLSKTRPLQEASLTGR